MATSRTTIERPLSLTTPLSVSWAFAVAFALAGVAGFLPNRLIGPDGLFMTNAAHNAVHLATAAAFVAVALVGERAAILFMRIFGVVYLAVGLLGIATLGQASEGYLLGLVHVNRADNLLHLGLGAAILGAGFLVSERSASPAE